MTMTMPTLYAWVPTDLISTHHDAMLEPSGPLHLVWMTTAPAAGAPLSGDGLTRVVVRDTRPVRRWLDVQHDHPFDIWAWMELQSGARPEYWFVSEVPVAVAIG